MRLALRLREALTLPPSEPLSPGDEIDWPERLHPAAVLIAITDRMEPGVVLTLRQSTLRRHAGQIAFPGGRIDPDDDGATAAALREAREEIGLDPALVELVGGLAPYVTGSGYRIEPAIGVIPPDVPLVPHEAEVAAVFEVPLAFLRDPANRRAGSARLSGRERQFHEIEWQDRRIWGITAGLIVNLSRQLGAMP